MAEQEMNRQFHNERRSLILQGSLMMMMMMMIVIIITVIIVIITICRARLCPCYNNILNELAEVREKEGAE